MLEHQRAELLLGVVGLGAELVPKVYSGHQLRPERTKLKYSFLSLCVYRYHFYIK